MFLLIEKKVFPSKMGGGGGYGGDGRFSERLRPHWGTIAGVATAGLGSKGIYCNDKKYLSVNGATQNDHITYRYMYYVTNFSEGFLVSLLILTLDNLYLVL